MINSSIVNSFSENFPVTKMRQLLQNTSAPVTAPTLPVLQNDTVEISNEALKAELLRVRDSYLKNNNDAFITLDHIKSNYDNSYLLNSIKGQTDDLTAISEKDFCNLSEIMKEIRLPKSVKVYRAMTTKDFGIGDISPEKFLQKYYKEGKEVVVPIYMSSSLDKKVAFRFAQHGGENRFILKLKVPKGHPAVYMEQLTPGDDEYFDHEEEINIIRNSTVKLGKINKLVNPLNNKLVYEIEATVTGFKDTKSKSIGGEGYEELMADSEMQDFVKALQEFKNSH